MRPLGSRGGSAPPRSPREDLGGEPWTCDPERPGNLALPDEGTGRLGLAGVMALQGGFAAHARALAALGWRTREVRAPRDLEGLDALVLPGGESGVQIDDYADKPIKLITVTRNFK